MEIKKQKEKVLVTIYKSTETIKTLLVEWGVGRPFCVGQHQQCTFK